MVPEVPADVHSIMALSAAITTDAIVTTITFVGLSNIAKHMKARQDTPPDHDK